VLVGDGEPVGLGVAVWVWVGVGEGDGVGDAVGEGEEEITVGDGEIVGGGPGGEVTGVDQLTVTAPPPGPMVTVACPETC